MIKEDQGQVIPDHQGSVVLDKGPIARVEFDLVSCCGSKVVAYTYDPPTSQRHLFCKEATKKKQKLCRREDQPQRHRCPDMLEIPHQFRKIRHLIFVMHSGASPMEELMFCLRGCGGRLELWRS